MPSLWNFRVLSVWIGCGLRGLVNFYHTPVTVLATKLHWSVRCRSHTHDAFDYKLLAGGKPHETRPCVAPPPSSAFVVLFTCHVPWSENYEAHFTRTNVFRLYVSLVLCCRSHGHTFECVSHLFTVQLNRNTQARLCMLTNCLLAVHRFRNIACYFVNHRTHLIFFICMALLAGREIKFRNFFLGISYYCYCSILNSAIPNNSLFPSDILKEDDSQRSKGSSWNK